MNKAICYIVGAGENYGLDFSPRPGDYVIAADGGFGYLEQAGITADLLIGDFDSLAEVPEHPNVLRLRREKDDTDTFAAIREGAARGYLVFHLYCCTGGRPEHTVANIQALTWLAENKMNGRLFGKENIFTVIKNAGLAFEAGAEGYISVFSVSEKSTGINLRGLKYDLTDATLTNDFPLGVSNEFKGVGSSVSVREGTVLIIYDKKHRLYEISSEKGDN